MTSITPHSKQQDRMRLMRLATYASVATATAIIIMKLLVWLLTDSLSLLSSLVDSVLDVGASLISFFAVRYALQPADEDHRFGHGKAEDIAAFAQSAFIAGSGLFISIEALHRFFNPQSVVHGWIGVAVMVASSVLTLGLLAFQRYVISQTNSSAIKADSLHYRVDLLVNVLVIMAFVIMDFSSLFVIDPIFAMIIAGYISFGAWKVGKEAFDNLMDREFSDEDRNKIIEATFNSKKVRGVHDLRTRRSGIKPFIQFHLELDGDMTLNEAHNISNRIESEVLKLFPDAEVLIHQDPQIKEPLAAELGQVVPVKK